MDLEGRQDNEKVMVNANHIMPNIAIRMIGFYFATKRIGGFPTRSGSTVPIF